MCVQVFCDECGEERWPTVTNAKQLESLGELCVKCNNVKAHAARSKYAKQPGMVRINGHACFETACPDCGTTRYVQATALREGAPLCRSCIGVRRMKVGIRDEHGKTCPTCKEYKPYSEYTRHRTLRDGHNWYCRACVRQKNETAGTRRAGLSRSEWKALQAKYDNRCLACGATDVPLEADHVIPKVMGGVGGVDNIQPLCKSCNCSKAGRYMDYRPDFERGATGVPDTSLTA
jgi:hypothetical protein